MYLRFTMNNNQQVVHLRIESRSVPMNVGDNGDKARRNTRTRAKIRKALTELIVEKGFDAMHICRADIDTYGLGE